MSYGQFSGHSRGRNNPFDRESADKPKREVFPTDEIPHKWAHQAQARARNAQGNLFFNGPTIYSYRTNWPLARIYEKRKGALKRCPIQGGVTLNSTTRDAMRDAGVLVLTNSERYSVTTAQHQSAVNQAASHLPQIAVSCVVVDDPYSMRDAHKVNLKHFASVAAESFARAERAMTEWRFDGSIASARRAVEDTAKYMRFFGLRRKAPVFDSARYAKARERIQRILNPNPASKDRRERERAKRVERNRERDEYLTEQRRSVQAAKQAHDLYRIGAARSSFRLGDAWGYDYEVLRSSDVMLRVKGEQIETSYGARVPAQSAPLIWELVQHTRACNVARLFNQSRMRIGDYPLDRIDANGDLHAGCHHIKYAELELMARRLGLTTEEQSK